jgi:hypothetical protein
VVVGCLVVLEESLRENLVGVELWVKKRGVFLESRQSADCESLGTRMNRWTVSERFREAVAEVR